MIKHIFCDLDGTLYHGGIENSDAQAIKEVESNNVRFNIATGRILNQAYAMTKDSLTINGYYICDNGAYVYDKDHKLVFKGMIEDNLVRKVISRFESDNAHIYFKNNEKIILTTGDEIFNKITDDYIVDIDYLKRETFNNEISNIGIISTNQEELARIELYLLAEFKDVLDIYFSSDYTLNIVKKGVSKRNGIEIVCKILGVPLDEIATIGDSPNDINMLEGIKYSFAMENARESVKQSANYIAKSVKDAIEQINKINGVE